MHLASKKLPHLLAILMQRGSDEVRWQLGAKLQNQLSQICLVGPDAVRLQAAIQIDLCRGHRLDLDDLGSLHLAKQAQDNALRFFRVRSPVNVSAGTCELLLELLQISIEVLQGLPANRRSRVS